MDMNCLDAYGNNCLLLQCSNYENIEIVRYLIEEQKIDINYKNNKSRNCFQVAYKYNDNIKIIKYFIEEQKMDITMLNSFFEEKKVNAVTYFGFGELPTEWGEKKIDQELIKLGY